MSLKRRLPRSALPKVSLDTYNELCRIGNNINQFIRKINSGIFGEFDLKTFHELKANLKKIAFEIIGRGANDR